MGNNLHTVRDAVNSRHYQRQMADTVNYHSLHCQWISVDQTAGELRYEGDGPHRPVAQFIGPKPLSESCHSFSIEIANTGRRCCIGIGVCHKRYPTERQPGWDHHSIGYHADNGGIYHETGHSRRLAGCVGQGEVMECVFDFTERSVTFLRNGTQVFTSPSLEIPRDGFYPIIGLHSAGEVVRLLEVEPWTPDNDTVAQSKDVVFHSMYCREARVSHRTGIVRYHSITRDAPIGQFVSTCELSPEHNKFSIEIASLGQRSCISVGVCHRCYPSNCQPGWLPNSIAYHAKDGGIYHGSDEPCSKGPRGRAGDTLSCEFDFSTKTFLFQRNGIMIFKISPVTIPPGGFHAAIGFHSAGEAVCLLERDPWRSTTGEEKHTAFPALERFGKIVLSRISRTIFPKLSRAGKEFESVRPCETEPLRNQEHVSSSVSTLPADNRTTPKCCICMDKGVARFLIPCGHTFCTECVEEWTAHHRTCPACRVPYSDIQMLYF